MLILFLPLMEREAQLIIYNNNITLNSLQNYQFGKSHRRSAFSEILLRYFFKTLPKYEKLVLQDFLSDTYIRL